MQNIDRLSAFWHATTKNQLEADLATLENSFSDGVTDLIDISVLGDRQQLPIAKLKQSRVDGIFRVLTAAINLLNVENWTLEDLHAYCIVSFYLRPLERTPGVNTASI